MNAANDPVVVTLHVLGGDRKAAIRGLCAALPGCEVAWVNSSAHRTDLELVADVAADRVASALWLAADRIGWDLAESVDEGTFIATARVTAKASAAIAAVDALAVA